MYSLLFFYETTYWVTKRFLDVDENQFNFLSSPRCSLQLMKVLAVVSQNSIVIFNKSENIRGGLKD